jgi:hypothetical protein
MKKIIKDSTQREKKATKVSRSEGSYKFLDQFKDLTVLKFKPVSPAFLERIGTEFVNWALEHKEEDLYNERKIKIEDFFAPLGISEKTCKEWRDKYPEFKEQYLFGKSLIGVRRERAAFWKKADASVFLKSAPTYDPEWERLEVWRAEMAEKILQNEKQILEIREIVANNGTSTSVPRVGTPETPVSSI